MCPVPSKSSVHIHQNITYRLHCSCRLDIFGVRFHCAICESVDVCQDCESVGLPGNLKAITDEGHNSSHIMMKASVEGLRLSGSDELIYPSQFPYPMYPSHALLAVPDWPLTVRPSSPTAMESAADLEVNEEQCAASSSLFLLKVLNSRSSVSSQASGCVVLYVRDKGQRR